LRLMRTSWKTAHLVMNLKVLGVPTILFCVGGKEKQRITADEARFEAVRARTERLLS
jgi:hypothetical protein